MKNFVNKCPLCGKEWAVTVPVFPQCPACITAGRMAPREKPSCPRPQEGDDLGLLTSKNLDLWFKQMKLADKMFKLLKEEILRRRKG
jgi:hypothetical protein